MQKPLRKDDQNEMEKAKPTVAMRVWRGEGEGEGQGEGKRRPTRRIWGRKETRRRSE